jgi:hypothetical protein
VAFGVWRLAFGVRRSAFGVRRLAFGVGRLAFGVRRLAFGVRRSAFGVQEFVVVLVVELTRRSVVSSQAVTTRTQPLAPTLVDDLVRWVSTRLSLKEASTDYAL